MFEFLIFPRFGIGRNGFAIPDENGFAFPSALPVKPPMKISYGTALPKQLGPRGRQFEIQRRRGEGHRQQDDPQKQRFEYFLKHRHTPFHNPNNGRYRLRVRQSHQTETALCAVVPFSQSLFPPPRA